MKRLNLLRLLVVLLLGIVAAGASSGFTFQGCWTQFSAGTCYDVFTDSAGNYWRCDACGTTKRPSSRTCFQINPSTGLWCS